MDYNLQFYSNLNNFYKERSGLVVSPYTSLFATVNPLSQFTSYESVNLPFLISGRLITTGDYKDVGYGTIRLSAEALKPTLEAWVGVHIYTSHAVYEKVVRGEDVSINETVGKIVRTEWNDVDGGIDFYAEIYDKQIAYKMACGLIKFISVGFGRDIVTQNKQFYFMNIRPKEASLVYDPRDKKAVFQPASI